jgi:hypothetical protein
VSKGADYKEYAAILLPSAMVNNDLEKIAMQLLDFQLVDVTKVAPPEPKTKKEKAKKCSEIIVATAHISDGRGRCRRQFFFKTWKCLEDAQQNVAGGLEHWKAAANF